MKLEPIPITHEVKMKKLVLLVALLFLSVTSQISWAAQPTDPMLSALDKNDGHWADDIMSRYGTLFSIGVSTRKDIMDTLGLTPALIKPWNFPKSTVIADMVSYQTTRFSTTYEMNFFFYSGSQKLCGYALWSGTTHVGGLTHDELVKSCGTQSKQ